MNYSNKIGSVLIYVLMLVLISVSMAVVILNTAWILSSNMEFINTQDKLYRVISAHSRLVFKLARTLNSDGSWFSDNLRCPQALNPWTITMSGATHTGVILTHLYIDSHFLYCSGSYLWQPLKINFNSGATDFNTSTYSGSSIHLIDSWVGKKWQTAFSDPDFTQLDFSSYNHAIWDWFDDNANSDNYTISSTGSTLYPWGFSDNDANHRLTQIGYISPWTGMYNIFWNNSKTSKQIDKNTNNDDVVNVKIGGISNGIMYLDINEPAYMTLYKFNKDRFNELWELKVLEKISSNLITSGVWYIQSTGGLLSLSWWLLWWKAGNEYIFDFQSSDYALFLENDSSNVLIYKLQGYTTTGSWMYIVPFDDSAPDLLRYLWNTIVLDDKKRLIYQQKEIISSK